MIHVCLNPTLHYQCRCFIEAFALSGLLKDRTDAVVNKWNSHISACTYC